MKLRKLEVRLIKKTLKTLEDGSGDAGSRKFFSNAKSEHVNAGTKRYGDSFEHLLRKHRKSARPKFLSG